MPVTTRTLACGLATMLCVTSLQASWGSPCETVVVENAETIARAVVAISRCSWEVGGEQYNAVTMTGTHTLTPSGRLQRCSAPGYCGTSIVLDVYLPNTLYKSEATYSARQLWVQIDEINLTDDTMTEPLRRPGDSDDPIDPNIPQVPCMEPGCSPIVIHLGNGSYDLTGREDTVAFDLDADGVRERLTWTAAGTAQAFLALDLNENGTIDDGRELFGTYTRLNSGGNAANGFVALAELDDDGGGIVDANDAAWSRLLLWVDANHDGVSQPEELRSIAESRIRSVATRHVWSGRRDAHGNTFRYRGEATLQLPNGATTPKTIYDVFFVAN